MPAIITDTLRLQIADLFFNDAGDGADSDEYYIGIGKSDQYSTANDNVISPLRTFLEERTARNNLQSVKKVEATSIVIPRYSWSSGSSYSGFTDNVVGIPSNSYYVLTESNEVYICLRAGQSTIQPNYATAGVLITEAFETSDGYRWKYLYELSAADASPIV